MNGYGTTHDFFTLASAGTLGGLTVTTCIVTNAIGKLLGGKRRWIGLGVGFVLTAAVDAYDGGNLLSYLLVIADGVLVYLAALGLTSFLVSITEPSSYAN